MFKSKARDKGAQKCQYCQCTIKRTSSTDSGITRCENSDKSNDAKKQNSSSSLKSVSKKKAPSTVVFTPNDGDSDVKIVVKGDFKTETLPKDEKKKLCFCFGKKKNNNNKQDCKASQKDNADSKDTNNQTSKCCLSNKGTGDSDTNQYKNLIKECKCKEKGGGGGCNTNTIILPKGFCCKGGGDSNNKDLENLIRFEAKNAIRHYEEILSELSKQRKEIREMRDILSSVVGCMKEGFAQNNSKSRGDVTKQNWLDRKSKTTSIKGNSQPCVTLEENTTYTEEVSGKKPFWLWCK